MVIVSQDKTQILNFENIQNVRIEPYGTHIKGKKIYKIFAGNFEGYAAELGTYNKEERAKEVLQEITEHYNALRRKSVYAMGDSGFTFEEKFYYEMPEDKED